MRKLRKFVVFALGLFGVVLVTQRVDSPLKATKLNINQKNFTEMNHGTQDR